MREIHDVCSFVEVVFAATSLTASMHSVSLRFGTCLGGVWFERVVNLTLTPLYSVFWLLMFVAHFGAQSVWSLVMVAELAKA